MQIRALVLIVIAVAAVPAGAETGGVLPEASGARAASPTILAGGVLSSGGGKGGEAARPMAREFGCRDFKRRPVRLMEVPELGDVGRAEYIGSGPVIKVDPAIMKTLPETLQMFFALHECGHHALGHLFAPTTDSEKEADCWAMKEGVRRKIFSATDIESWRPFFQNSRGSDMHLPGPKRVAFMVKCLDD